MCRLIQMYTNNIKLKVESCNFLPYLNCGVAAAVATNCSFYYCAVFLCLSVMEFINNRVNICERSTIICAANGVKG